MSNHIAILGAGGFAREAYWHIRGTDPEARLVFVDDVTETRLLDMGGLPVPVVKDWRFQGIPLDGERIDVGQYTVGAGDPKVKRLLVAKAIEAGLEAAATFIHPRAILQGSDCTVGRGGVITPGCVVTTNVRIGDHVILNLNTTIGHDTIIGDYVTINPGSSISGNVTLGDGVSLGTGTVVRDGVHIANGVITGAQACVVKDIEEPGIVIAGVPAKRLR